MATFEKNCINILKNSDKAFYQVQAAQKPLQALKKTARSAAKTSKGTPEGDFLNRANLIADLCDVQILAQMDALDELTLVCDDLASGYIEVDEATDMLIARLKKLVY